MAARSGGEWGPSKGESRRRGDTAGRDVWRAPDPRKASSSRLMALSSAVVVVVYAAGYGRTETAARQAAASLSAFAGSIAGAQANGAGASTTGASAAPRASSSAATPAAGPAPGSSSFASASAASPSPAASSAPASGPAASTTASSAAAAPPAAAPAKPPATAKYKDGTFSAQGWGPHGPMTVAVVVNLGRIVSANVTQCGTTYTCQYMDPLVRSVVSLQGPPVDYVSGATASSMAYYQAVTAALQKAR